MIRSLLALMRPLHTIARELTVLRELYEAELALHDPPVYRLTEKPRKSDTEVTYTGVEEEPRRKHRMWFTE